MPSYFRTVSIFSLGALSLGLFLSAPAIRADDSLPHFIYPLTSKTLKTPPVSVDVSETPDLQAWADEAKKLVEDWYPIIGRFLATETLKSPKQIKLVFKKDLQVPAYTAGGEMTINGSWVRQHPDDFGMVIHEMTHILQSYPGGAERPGWLVEGIADYIRFWKYEPEYTRPRINPQKSSYRDSYRTTGAFLAWLTFKYDHRIVPQLDRAMREKADPLPIFSQVTGKSLDALWEEFVQGYK